MCVVVYGGYNGAIGRKSIFYNSYNTGVGGRTNTRGTGTRPSGTRGKRRTRGSNTFSPCTRPYRRVSTTRTTSRGRDTSKRSGRRVDNRGGRMSTTFRGGNLNSRGILSTTTKTNTPTNAGIGAIHVGGGTLVVMDDILITIVTTTFLTCRVCGHTPVGVGLSSCVSSRMCASRLLGRCCDSRTSSCSSCSLRSGNCSSCNGSSLSMDNTSADGFAGCSCNMNLAMVNCDRCTDVDSCSCGGVVS